MAILAGKTVKISDSELRKCWYYAYENVKIPVKIMFLATIASHLLPQRSSLLYTCCSFTTVQRETHIISITVLLMYLFTFAVTKKF